MALYLNIYIYIYIYYMLVNGNNPILMAIFYDYCVQHGMIFLFLSLYSYIYIYIYIITLECYFTLLPSLCWVLQDETESVRELLMKFALAFLELGDPWVITTILEVKGQHILSFGLVYFICDTLFLS